MIKFKDISGVSEPIKRLIEVVAEGIGGVSRPILTRKNADAKAYEIRTITEAVVDSQKLLGGVTYHDGKIVIESSSGEETPLLPEAPPDKRIVSRMSYQEAKRQLNIEKVTQYAAEEFNGTETMGEERPDSDWTTRFFRIAEDITSEQMQGLWGKVLAGEVKRPGSFSLRTLDILKNISQKEAETFSRVARIAFLNEGKAFIPNPDHEEFMRTQFNITFQDLLLLREIGLLAPTNLRFGLIPAAKDTRSIFTCGLTCIEVNRPAGTPEQYIPSVIFTEIGKQLISLVERTPVIPQYITHFAAFFQKEGVVVRSGKIVQWDSNNNTFKYTDIQEVPGNKPKIIPTVNPQHTT